MKKKKDREWPIKYVFYLIPKRCKNLLKCFRCGRLDTDLAKCKWSERRDAFLHSCSHDSDVGLRCYDVSWSGIRLGMTAKRSKLFDVKVMSCSFPVSNASN